MLDAVPVPGLQLHGIPSPLAPSKAAQWHMRAWSLSGVEVLFKPALLMLALSVGRCFHLHKSENKLLFMAFERNDLSLQTSW